MRLFVVAFVLACLQPALAHAQLDDGEDRLAEADFAGAVRAFDAAEAGTGLERDELVRLYSRRAVAHLALGANAAMEADLRRLASLDPEHRFEPEARPEITETFSRLVAAQERPLSLEVETEQQPGGVRFTATVQGDTSSLAREIRVAARREGADFLTGNGSLTVPVTGGGTLEYYAVVIGPGGAPIASQGSEEAPLRLELQTSSAAVGAVGSGTAPPIAEEDDDGGVPAGVWIGVGLGVVAAAAIVAIILLGSAESDVTQPAPPTIFE